MIVLLSAFCRYVVHVDIKSDQELLDDISSFVDKRDNIHQVN